MDTSEESTGYLMTQMLRFGPSTLNAVMVYENLALSNLQTAEGRWGKIKVAYPKRSVWNDNPFYILDVPWSTPEQREAAKLFQDFLLEQGGSARRARPVPVPPGQRRRAHRGAGQRLQQAQGVVQVDVPAIQRPSAEVLNHIQVWKRIH